MEQESRLKSYLFQTFFFICIMGLGLLAGYRGLYKQTQISRALNSLGASSEMGAWEFIIAFIIITLILYFFLGIVKGNAFFEFVFYLAMAWGIFLVLAQFIPILLASYITACLIILNAVYYRVWLHNIILIFGIAGISINFGVRISVIGVLIIFLFLVVYDYIAVYKTKHMVKMFHHLRDRGIVLSLVVPQKIKNFSYKMESIVPGKEFIMIGTGDLAFPTIFAISILRKDIPGAITVAISALIGIIVTQYIFIRQKERKPIPALPPILLFTVLGYLFHLIFLTRCYW